MTPSVLRQAVGLRRRSSAVAQLLSVRHRFYMFHLLIRKIFTKFLYIFWFAVTLPPVLLMAQFFNDHEDLRADFGWIGFIVVLASLFGSWWLGMTTSRYMFDEKRMFLEALKLTLSDLRFKLAHILALRAWFAPDEDKSKHDDDDA